MISLSARWTPDSSDHQPPPAIDQVVLINWSADADDFSRSVSNHIFESEAISAIDQLKTSQSTYTCSVFSHWSRRTYTLWSCFADHDLVTDTASTPAAPARITIVK